MAFSATSNQELMRQARVSLQGNWKLPVLVTLVYLFVFGSVQSLLINLLVSGPISLGFAFFYIAIVREHRFETAEFGRASQQLLTAFVTYLLVSLFILLWSLLLIIPGIMAALSYAMVFYVLRDQPESRALLAIERSKELMYGNRWKLLYLLLRFLGWFILSIVTLGIGFLWTLPYLQASLVHFYEDLLRSEAEAAPALTQA